MSTPKSTHLSAKGLSNRHSKLKGSARTKNLESGGTTQQKDMLETLSAMGVSSVSSGRVSSHGDQKICLSVSGILREAAVLYEERGKLYGHNYKDPFALVMSGLQAAAAFDSDAMTLSDWSRFGLLVQIAYKLTRYCNQFHAGGHLDSARDIAVYAAMLEELTINS